MGTGSFPGPGPGRAADHSPPSSPSSWKRAIPLLTLWAILGL